MIVIINGHTYHMKRIEYNKFLNYIRKTIPQNPTIVAVEKKDNVEMRNDIYPNRSTLMQAVKRWNKAGFTVKYIRGATQN